MRTLMSLCEDKTSEIPLSEVHNLRPHKNYNVHIGHGYTMLVMA